MRSIIDMAIAFSACGIAIVMAIIIFIFFYIQIAKLGRFIASIFNGGRDEPFSWHSRWGHFRIIYPDGHLSQPMTKRLARQYANRLGGVIVPKGKGDVWTSERQSEPHAG